MKIEILGPGCPNCIKLYKNTEEAVKELGINAELEKVTDYGRILGYGIMATPGFVVDGIVKSSGKLLKVEEIKSLLK
jgi:small redox-active disulfide protein 2